MYHIRLEGFLNFKFNLVGIDKYIISAQNCPKFDILMKIAIILQYLERDRPTLSAL